MLKVEYSSAQGNGTLSIHNTLQWGRDSPPPPPRPRTCVSRSASGQRRLPPFCMRRNIEKVDTLCTRHTHSRNSRIVGCVAKNEDLTSLSKPDLKVVSRNACILSPKKMASIDKVYLSKKWLPWRRHYTDKRHPTDRVLCFQRALPPSV